MKNPPPWIEVRGEAFIPRATFKAINEEQAKLYVKKAREMAIKKSK